jgi:hypothetical protein
MGFEELGYGEFPDIKAMALALSQALDTVAELARKVHELETKIDSMKIQSVVGTGGFIPRNRMP